MHKSEIDQYLNFLSYYEEGLYTDNEVISSSIDLLYKSTNRDAIWYSLKPEHREKIAKCLESFDESDIPFAINADPIEVWRCLSALKKWLLG